VRTIFLHIPRTGGTTLTRIARRQYRPEGIYVIDSTEPARSAAALSSLPPFVRDRLSLIAGHASFGVHRHLGDGQYFTLIRDPIERVLSHYRYAQQRYEHPLHELALQMSLSEIVDADLWRDLSNGQCRALAGEWDFATQEQPGSVLDLARDNLAEHFVLWGLTERFAETLLMAQVVLGWRDVSYTPENATQRRAGSTRTGADVEAAVRCNALDIALYEELEARFQQGLDELVPDWRRQLTRLEVQSRLAAPKRRLRRSYEQARRRALRRERLADDAGGDHPTAPQNGHGQAEGDDPAYTAAWLRRWVVGGYDWQTGQKEWVRRRIAGDYSWGRIAESFAFTEEMLEPCPSLRRKSAYDAGSGAGHVSFALASHFESVLAVDRQLRSVSRARLLARASRIDRIRFALADASRFDPGERFDLILCNVMSHTGGGRLGLLRRLATLTDHDGWMIYAEEAQGYPPMEIEAAIADRDLLRLRTHLRQVSAGIRGDHASRFFVAPSAGAALESLGFEVVEEDVSWWRSLPSSHRIWCRKARSATAAAVGDSDDYVEPPKDLVELRERLRDGRPPSTDNRLAPLLMLTEMARYALPHLPAATDTRLAPIALRALDSRAQRAIDWARVEELFAQFVDAVERDPPPTVTSYPSAVAPEMAR
jgi:SAM-dependent methyltransferase